MKIPLPFLVFGTCLKELLMSLLTMTLVRIEEQLWDFLFFSFLFFFFWDNKFIIVIFQTIWVYLQAEKVIHQYEIAENSIKYHHENTSIEQGIQFRDIESRGFHWFCLQQQHLSSNHNSGIYRLYANAGFMEFHERWNCLMGVQLQVRHRGSHIPKLPASIYSPYRKDSC